MTAKINPIDLSCKENFDPFFNAYFKKVDKTDQKTSHLAKRKFIPIPPTPGKKHRGLKNGPPFIGARPIITNDLDPLKSKLHEFLNLETIYTDKTGVKHNVLKQPEGSKSCWAYSLAMLLTDLERSGKNLPIDNSFQDWMEKAYLEKADTVQKEANRINIPLEKSRIPCENPLPFIREKIEMSRYPVLSGISHPILNNHTIVIDHIDDTNTTIRDPNTGKAWMIDNAIVEEWYQDGIEEECLSVIPQDAT